MRWKNLSIGKKLVIGFGSVLVLLIFISGYNYLNFTEVDHLAHESIETAAVNEFMLQKTVDHLNWASALNDFVFKDETSFLVCVHRVRAKLF